MVFYSFVICSLSCKYSFLRIHFDILIINKGVTMKKYLSILCIMLLGSIINNLSAMESARLQEGYTRSKRVVESLQGAALRRAAIQGALLGGVAGAGAGFVGITVDPQLAQTWPQIAGALGGSIVGAGVGAGVSMVNALAKSTFMLWKINQVLHVYTSYTFKNLPIDPAVMVLAAYRKNIKLMQYVAPQVQSFLNEQGVWEALAHLYFGLPPTPKLIAILQKMVGFGR
jgi:hypothetical protein